MMHEGGARLGAVGGDWNTMRSVFYTYV